MSETLAPQDTCVLVTGGAGFIGSHTCVELLQDGYKVVIVDDLSNASEKVEDRIKTIVGPEAAANLELVIADVNDRDALEKIFSTHKIDRVIHFAGFKAVGESVSKPLEYYHQQPHRHPHARGRMRDHGCKRIVFSSSATVYGRPGSRAAERGHAPRLRHQPLRLHQGMIEQILSDLHTADPEWNVVLLRYFNPIGAHESGLIGEDPNGIPNNLVPYVAQVAIGKLRGRPRLRRRLRHPGRHRRARLHPRRRPGARPRRRPRLEHGPDRASRPSTSAPARAPACSRSSTPLRRPAATRSPTSSIRAAPATSRTCYADASKARELLGWEATCGIDDMCRSSWNWQSKNPNGYEG